MSDYRYVVKVKREDLSSGYITSDDTLTPYMLNAYVFMNKAAANKAAKKRPSPYTGWGKVEYEIIPVVVLEIPRSTVELVQ